eukprot:TRINITY_DN5973_c0_g1_i1.p1 TRINITY_DN5973_c0_g1~~TRINITY_DN5973_c0_g1_i1.p1  ORF type:complete len:111 (+),score=21.34 TRINITY_DN5973_c0_g1_i1:76-408(+)
MCVCISFVIFSFTYSLLFLFFFFFKQKTAYEMLRSLVGSEMCIRDRFYVPKNCDRPLGYELVNINYEFIRMHWGRKYLVLLTLLLTLTLHGLGADPVSYTHLTLPTKRIV